MSRVRAFDGSRIPGVLAATLLLAACPGPGDDPLPDGPGSDGGGDGRGLTLGFASTAPMPVTSGVATVTELVLEASTVRAIGDAAPGDERTTRHDTRLRWREGETPEPIAFDAAPVGLYSTVAVRLAERADDTAFRVLGETLRQGARVDFDIESRASLDLSIPVEAMLAPGEDLTLRLDVDIAALVASIDWDAQPLDGGTIAITDGSPAMAAVVAALRSAIAPRATAP